MKATCPRDPKHKKFQTVAHVTEDWIVDEHGEFIEVAVASEMYVVAPPMVGNTWTCEECGATASVEED